MPNDPFVDVGDLPRLGRMRYLDARDQAAFDAGHAPGAVRVPRLDTRRANLECFRRAHANVHGLGPREVASLDEYDARPEPGAPS